MPIVDLVVSFHSPFFLSGLYCTLSFNAKDGRTSTTYGPLDSGHLDRLSRCVLKHGVSTLDKDWTIVKHGRFVYLTARIDVEIPWEILGPYGAKRVAGKKIPRPIRSVLQHKKGDTSCLFD